MAAGMKRRKLLMTFGNSVSTSNIFTRIVSYARSTFLTSRHLLPGNHHHHSDASLDRQLDGWWVGISGEAKYPSGQIVHISAEQGRYLARSYSPWQLATAKTGTPVFEIYAIGSEGEYKEQAIYIKHKEACPYSSGSLQDMKVCIGMFPLTRPSSKTDQANGAAVDSLVEKAAVCSGFVVGDIVEKVPGTHNKKVVRVPATFERKESFLFCLTLEGDQDQDVYDDNDHEVYRTTHHDYFKFVEFIGIGTPMKNISPKEDKDRYISLLVSRARNQQPLLSRITNFIRIDIPTSSDPLNGLYIGSNGYLASEVIQLRNFYAPWHEVGGIENVSEPELCKYVEAVNLTGDFDMAAGQVMFRAKVGEKYKLRPEIDLEEMYGAVDLYKGKGRLPGFQNSEWVDVDVLIIGEEHCEDGIAIAVLYSAPEYYFLKFFKQLNLQSFQESH
ncbi:protein EXECUTER 1, chloroplastic [Daucus carota subsp. sativus]|uniref:protein EXECUTER 1, chloroplastic n=1 Tax=Daucus carota subsp. sativus TaxID=79200 RepID=UPI003083D3AF